ncbi:MAG: hypothetical protein JXA50_07905 [Deltaproteobacteria bacterium]|nr:hypothetical protein [Deltaproteobacteria bacterium]
MRYLVKFRYYPGDPLQEIREADLRGIAEQWSLQIAFEQVQGAMQDGREVTLDKDLEEISQSVITIEGDEEPSLRGALREIITKYRSPRTCYALWGSNPEGQAIATEIIEEQDGWW